MRQEIDNPSVWGLGGWMFGEVRLPLVVVDGHADGGERFNPSA